MTSLSNFHALAATRGEGLRPELRNLFERNVEEAHSEPALRNGSVVQLFPDPIRLEPRSGRHPG